MHESEARPQRCQEGLEPVNCESQVRCPANSATALLPLCIYLTKKLLKTFSWELGEESLGRWLRPWITDSSGADISNAALKHGLLYTSAINLGLHG